MNDTIFRNVTYRGNTAKVLGGAVYHRRFINTTFEDMLIENNSNSDDHSVMYVGI